METLVHGSVTIATRKLGREGGRGAHDPAPASASLYGFAADCPARDHEPLFTSAWLGGQRTALQAAGAGGTNIPISGLDGEVE